MARSIGFLEHKHRVVFSLLRAAARVGLRLRVPIDQMQALLDMALFQEARVSEGLELEAIAGRFGKSVRTVASLHARFRSDFFAPEHDVALRRDVAACVTARSRRPEEVRAAFPDRSEGDVDAALDDLLREGKLVRDGEKVARNPSDHDFLHEGDANARIDGVNRQMDVLAEAVWRRLVEPADGATARTFVFRARPEDRDALLRDLLAFLQARAVAADDAAEADPSPERVGITLAISPLPETPR